MKAACVLAVAVLLMTAAACGPAAETGPSDTPSGEGNVSAPADESPSAESGGREPADISDEIMWAYEAEDAELGWTFVNGLTSLKEGTATLTREQFHLLLDCLADGPVYKWEQADTCMSLDLGLSVRYGSHALIMRPMTDGTVFISSDNELYTYRSGPLYAELFGCTAIETYPDFRPGDVVSADIEYIGEDGEIERKAVSSPEAIEKLAGAILSDDAIRSCAHDVFNPTARVTLRTADETITVLFIASSEYAAEPEYVINEFYWFISAEAVDILKACVDDAIYADEG